MDVKRPQSLLGTLAKAAGQLNIEHEPFVVGPTLALVWCPIKVDSLYYSYLNSVLESEAFGCFDP